MDYNHTMKNTTEKTDAELISTALNAWGNMLETGNPEYNAVEASEAGAAFRALTLDEMKLVIRVRDLATQFLETSSS
jgi:hypothetical protein